MDFIFEAVCYVSAIALTLSLFGSRCKECGNALQQVKTVDSVGSFGSDRTTPQENAIVEAATAAIVRYWQKRPLDNVVPFRRRAATPDWSTLSRDQLRAICNQRGIATYEKVEGKRKFFSRDRLVELLSA